MPLLPVLTSAVVGLGGLCAAASPPHTVPLIELFTSQGCSSCPPADRWLSRLRPGDQLVPLSLHVGYWDHIGWKDPFARREFTERQRARAQANDSRAVYTPAVFVQGVETRRWHDDAALRRTLAEIRRRPAVAHVELSARREADMLAVTVRASAADRPNARVQIALAQGGHVTRVTAGENRRETLSNEHVVRTWSGPHELGTRTLRLGLPAETGGPLTLVAIVEEGADVLQVMALPITGCAG